MMPPFLEPDKESEGSDTLSLSFLFWVTEILQLCCLFGEENQTRSADLKWNNCHSLSYRDDLYVIEKLFRPSPTQEHKDQVKM